MNWPYKTSLTLLNIPKPMSMYEHWEYEVYARTHRNLGNVMEEVLRSTTDSSKLPPAYLPGQQYERNKKSSDAA
jgi:hypothetical protein